MGIWGAEPWGCAGYTIKSKAPPTPLGPPLAPPTPAWVGSWTETLQHPRGKDPGLCLPSHRQWCPPHLDLALLSRPPGRMLAALLMALSYLGLHALWQVTGRTHSRHKGNRSAADPEELDWGADCNHSQGLFSRISGLLILFFSGTSIPTGSPKFPFSLLEPPPPIGPLRILLPSHQSSPRPVCHHRLSPGKPAWATCVLPSCSPSQTKV